MPDGQLWLDPVRAMDGARNLAAAGADLAALRVGTGAELEERTAARPWGADDIGEAFHKQYAPIAAQVLVAWEKLAAHIEGLGAAAAQSVIENQRADDEASVRMTHSYGKR
jgi:hypothetical protein